MRKYLFSVLILCLSFSFTFAQEEARLLRFPAMHGDQVVFSYAGDLYTVSSDGGFARKLTAHNGFEMFAKFSPDGKTIAFTGQYDGNTEVFTIPAEGGIPKRITYTATLGRDDVGDRMGPNNIVTGWTPDGENIVYRSRKQTFNSFKGQIFKVSKDGGISEELPFSVAGFNSFSEDGTKLAYNRVFREFRTWKYYKGGMADDVWLFDFNTKETINVSNNPAQDIFPMYKGDVIYYLSDRDRIMNLFSYHTKTQETKKLTDFDTYDIKFPSIGDQAIVFENGGYIYKYDLASGKYSKISIRIANDFADARNEIKNLSGSARYFSLAPNAERLIVGARGELFNIPADEGLTYNITQSSGAHDRNPAWSPDGKHIAYISDKSGEFEIYIQDLNGEETQITKGEKTYKFNLEWSPDSKMILWNDKNFNLQYVDIDSKKKVKVASSDMNVIRSFNWSPDSKWICFVNPDKEMSRISLYNLDNKKTNIITDNWYSSNSPAFSKDGKYIVFSSARDFNPTYSSTEWNHSYSDMNRIYLIALSKETPSPFMPKDDVVMVKEDDKADKKSSAKVEDDKSIKIDLEGIMDRVIGLPIRAGNYFNITPLEDKIYYAFTSRSSGGFAFKMFDLKKKKESELGSNINFIISPNGKKMLLMQGRRMGIVNTPQGPAKITKTIDLSNVKASVDFAQEWQNIFDESWRHMRDFFYDPNMHGVNWDKIYKKYNQLVPYVRHRSDLTYIIGEMIGELNVGHAYANNGERPMPKRVSTGLLGAKISKDASGYFKIDHIIPGNNWNRAQRSPLLDLGVNIQEGDLIVSIDGHSTKKLDDIYKLLVDKANKVVKITVRSEANGEDKTSLVTPIADESQLYYYEWVQNNIKKVTEATDGQVGYIHVPDMGTTGLNEFVKHYYPQLTKKALIIDDRGNGGGNVSPMLIERLKREITYATMHTGQKFGNVNPVGTLVGPKVALIDRYSASDGDLFPYRFKYNKLGKLIGTRTWGGVVGYSGSIPCIDGGSIITPSYAPYAADGSEFIIEGRGVVPDILLENDPYDEYMGKDDQLTKAIEVILEELKNYEQKIPPIPDFPDKSK